ncbi:MAG: RagB/SusD family nutrient uptake outer membrane protein [Rikenellaceae bacterium]
MKTINLLYISIMLLFAITSCDSLLDVSTKHALPQDKIKTVAGCESIIVGVYDLLQDATYAGRDLICVPDVMGDNCQPSPSSTKYSGQYNFQPYYNIDIWESSYKQIGALNEAILYLSELEQTDKVKALTGEALFLRAYNYFNLSIIYSRVPGHLVDNFNLCVPLITEPFFNEGGSITEQASIPRSTVDAVWSKIVEDLTDSFALLENNDQDNSPYRISAVAVKAFQSRVYLYKGDWPNAISSANYAITKASVKLYDGDYTDIFSDGAESIWQLHYIVTENLKSTSLHSTYGTYDNGVRDAEGYGDGTGAGDAQLSISADFIGLIDQDKDTRFQAMRKVHYYGQSLWWTTKFNSWGGVFGLDDVPIIRISEVYLNRAEAYAHQSNYTSARADIDLLRSKRGLSNTDASNSELLNEILLQRRIELAFEGHRFFDMKRLGLPISRPNGLSEVPYDDYRVVAPISTTEMDVNKELVNNPGY